MGNIVLLKHYEVYFSFIFLYRIFWYSLIAVIWFFIFEDIKESHDTLYAALNQKDLYHFANPFNDAVCIQIRENIQIRGNKL